MREAINFDRGRTFYGSRLRPSDRQARRSVTYNVHGSQPYQTGADVASAPIQSSPTIRIMTLLPIATMIFQSTSII